VATFSMGSRPVAFAISHPVRRDRILGARGRFAPYVVDSQTSPLIRTEARAGPDPYGERRARTPRREEGPRRRDAWRRTRRRRARVPACCSRARDGRAIVG